MSESTALAIGAIAGSIVFLAIILHIKRHKKLHDEWLREMNGQAEPPFNRGTEREEIPEKELVTRA